ncbi:protein-arginine deiminase family protein [Austwickia chelonae]|uniref:protein-arginine deiminase family protein n=1 Tax=Austwickia chelonae TaxID=100225 RepID=UPI000E2244B8|nr:protein-arginine deiminase family protein [Austwickia chelonae]
MSETVPVRRSRLALLAALSVGSLSVLSLSACTGSLPGGKGSVSIDLRVDANRDGKVDLAGDSDKDGKEASVTRGAVFLANVDDDSARCETNQDGGIRPLGDLASCHDGADEIVNGPEDEKDLAPVRTVPKDVPEGTTAEIWVEGAAAERTRLFLKRGDQWSPITRKDKINAEELKKGLTMGLEGRDVLRDLKAWDGVAEIHISVTSDGRKNDSSVKLRQAPLIAHHHLQKASSVFIGPDESGHGDAPAFKDALKKTVEAEGATLSQLVGDELRTGGLFEPMYQQLPTESGEPHTMRVMALSDQARDGSAAVYLMRGQDVGVIRTGNADSEETLNSMSNYETLPPHSVGDRKFSLGRAVVGHRLTKPTDYPRGHEKPKEPEKPADNGAGGGGNVIEEPMISPALHQKSADEDKKNEERKYEDKDPRTPSESTSTFFRAQSDAEPLVLDVGFLRTGHVDEIVQVLPADTTRGWKVAIADPKAGSDLVEHLIRDGRGGQPHAKGEPESLEQVWNPETKRHNANAAEIMAKNVDRLREALDLKDDDIVRVPVLYRLAERVYDDENRSRERADDPNDNRYVSSLLPNAVSSLVLHRGKVVVPEQHGPQDAQGKDVFAEAVKEAYAKAGASVIFLDDRRPLHLDETGIHQGTNSWRETTSEVR